MIRKSSIFFLSLIIIFSLCQILFASPRVNILGLSDGFIDLGKMKEGVSKKSSISIENAGDEILIIKSVQPSCGCVKIISPQKELLIKPKEKQEIVFSFNSTGYSGITKEYLYLETNDPSQKSLRIEARALVLRSLSSITKRFMQFSPVFILSAGLVDGINPCAFTVIVFFMSFLFFVGYSRKEIFIVGGSFILAVFLTYLLIGLGILGTLRHLSSFVYISRILYYLTAILAFILGLLSLIDFWQYHKTKSLQNIILKLPDFLKNRITRVINKSLDKRRRSIKDIFSLIAASFSCGIIVSLLESACTGQMYLPTIVFMLKNSALKLRALVYLLLYNVMFIFPLIIIFLLAGFGVSSQTFSRIAGKNIGIIKLLTAILFFALGVFLLLVI
ncbi:MAG: DUF1573 domain-containing protein [Candidatus Omnitrophota bacterium]